MHKSRFWNLPNILTLIRLTLSPILLPILIYYLLPLNILWMNICLSILFVILSLTDFFDGYFARRYKLETNLGKLLDPIADKFLITSSLIALLAVNRIYFFWVVIFIGRELFIMCLRQIALENQFSISVAFAGKIKTLFQTLMITVLIANPVQNLGFYNYWNIIEKVLIFLSLFFSIMSAIKYYKCFQCKYNQLN